MVLQYRHPPTHHYPPDSHVEASGAQQIRSGAEDSITYTLYVCHGADHASDRGPFSKNTLSLSFLA